MSTGLIDAVLDWLADNIPNVIKVRTFSLSGVSTAAGGVHDYLFNINETDYKPLGIIGTSIASGGRSSIVTSWVTSTGIGTSTATVRVVNNGSSSQTPDSVKIDVLYVRRTVA